MTTLESLPIEGAQLNWVDTLPGDLPGATKFGNLLQVRPGEVLFELPNIARFFVSGGERIDVEVAAGSTRERAASFARIGPYGCLVHQRGELPLHSSAVSKPGESRALLICGDSGAGKSTTAAAFAKRGWRILNDDLSRIALDGQHAITWPGFRSLKLWEEACRLLDIDRTRLPETGEVKHKYFWSPAVADGPHEIAAIVELQSPAANRPELERLRGGAAVEMLMRQTFRARLVRALGIEKEHFLIVAEVARRAACFRLGDPGLAPLELAEYLESSIW